MRSQQEEKPPQVEVRDEAHIADVVEALGSEAYGLSARLEPAATAFPVTLMHIDPGRRTMALSLLDAQSLGEAELAGSAMLLRAESESEALHFDELAMQAIKRVGDHLEIQCAFPRALYTTSKRRSVRITFTKGMQARTRTRVTVFPDHPPFKAHLRNLSSGGCLLEVPLSESAFLRIDEKLPAVSFEFPNGETFAAPGLIRHVKPAGRSHFAAVGISFYDLTRDQKQRLIYFVNEAEREAAYRVGHDGRTANASSLFSSERPEAPHDKGRAQQRKAIASPMVNAIREIARQLHIALLALQNQRPLASEALYACADTLLEKTKYQRADFLYALSCLHQEPQWIQHSINVAGKLGDLMLDEPEYAPRARAAVVAALLHDMGKAMLLSEELTTLEGELNVHQRMLLRGHVERLLEHLEPADWLDDGACHDIIVCINERLDGSGYPMGRRADELSPLARMAAVIDVIDAMTRPRGDRVAETAIEAYRHLYNRPERFDKWWVTRYIQRHGFYPIGSLVKFSHGYLAWVMELDDVGQPARVRVVRNVARCEFAIDYVLSRIDFGQLGKLECLVRPEDYQLLPF